MAKRIFINKIENINSRINESLEKGKIGNAQKLVHQRSSALSHGIANGIITFLEAMSLQEGAIM